MEFDETLESATNLGISGIFNGAIHDTMQTGQPRRQHITIGASSDQAGTIILECSDETTWTAGDREVARAAVAAAQGNTISAYPNGRYWRVRYLNGATAQTKFRLTSQQREHG